MNEPSSLAPDDAIEPREPLRLSFDVDADVCIVGAGIAGLHTAVEAARLGASVAVLEGRHLGWGASGHNLGTVMPGYNVAIDEMIARVGRHATQELWALSSEGMNLVRANVAEDRIPALSQSEGALEVSNVGGGDRLLERLQTLNAFGTEAEGWQVDQVRGAIKTSRYFHGVHYPKAFQVDGRRYMQGLVTMARRAGVRIFEDTPVVNVDAGGVRKRIVTPMARLRASHIVLAGNVHLGQASRRLSDTLLPVWRYAAVTEPLGDRIGDAIKFAGSVIDCDGIDHYRVLEGGRLMWSSPRTTWNARPKGFASAIRRRIRTVFPQLGRVQLKETFGGATGETVHGMPQIGEVSRGLWVASGFGRQGLATSALAGHLIARSILLGDDRWRLFAPFELVWAGGATGRAVGQAVGLWQRGSFAAAGAMARYREGAKARESQRENRRDSRLADAKRRAAIRMSPQSQPPSRSGTPDRTRRSSQV